MQQLSYLQTNSWANFKAKQGWQQHKLSDVSILERQLPYIKRSMLYVPECVPPRNFTQFLSELKQLGKKQKSLFIRLELLVPTFSHLPQLQNKDLTPEEEIAKLFYHKLYPTEPIHSQELNLALHQQNFRKSFEEVQPANRQWVNLSGPEDILETFSSKGRYNVNLAKRKQVKIIKADLDQPSSKKLVERFFSLYSTTAKRKGFSHRSLEYIQDLATTLGKDGTIFLTTHENDDLAGVINVHHKNIASYLYGASSDIKRNLMAPYLVQAAAIQTAKEKGCLLYDLLAIAPPESSNHPYSGITMFKKRFGGMSVEIMGSYDLILNPFLYKLFSFAEKIRRR